MEQRLIDANELMEKLSRMIDFCQKDKTVNGLIALFQVGDAIMDCPTVDAVPVAHGHWETNDMLWGKERCSVCDRVVKYRFHEMEHPGRVSELKMNYCPNCGAKMDEVSK